jgi:hypothetical protein
MAAHSLLLCKVAHHEPCAFGEVKHSKMIGPYALEHPHVAVLGETSAVRAPCLDCHAAGACHFSASVCGREQSRRCLESLLVAWAEENDGSLGSNSGQEEETLAFVVASEQGPRLYPLAVRTTDGTVYVKRAEEPAERAEAMRDDQAKGKHERRASKGDIASAQTAAALVTQAVALEVPKMGSDDKEGSAKGTQPAGGNAADGRRADEHDTGCGDNRGLAAEVASVAEAVDSNWAGTEENLVADSVVDSTQQEAAVVAVAVDNMLPVLQRMEEAVVEAGANVKAEEHIW